MLFMQFLRMITVDSIYIHIDLEVPFWGRVR